MEPNALSSMLKRWRYKLGKAFRSQLPGRSHRSKREPTRDRSGDCIPERAVQFEWRIEELVSHRMPLRLRGRAC
jgi:hypothetical protein